MYTVSMSARISWKALFDKGFTPRQITNDPGLFSWYDHDKHKSPMYRAYRSWRSNKKGEVAKNLVKRISTENKQAPKEIRVVDTLPSDLNDRLDHLIDKMTLEITRERLSYQKEAVKLARVLLADLKNDPSVTPSIKVRLLEVLVHG